MQGELPVIQGLPQVALQVGPRGDGDQHLRVEKTQGIAARTLHLVHGNVGLLEQVHRALLGVAEQGGPQAAGAAVHRAVQVVGLCQAGEDSVTHPLGMGFGFRFYLA